MNNKTKYSPNAGLERKIYYFTGFEFVTCFKKKIICVSRIRKKAAKMNKRRRELGKEK